MNATKLSDARSKVCAYACGKCGRIWANEPGAEFAEACCRCSECKEPVDTSKGDYSSIHNHCWHERQARINAKRLETAVEVTDYDGWLFVEDLTGHNEGYFRNEEELRDYVADLETDEPYSVEWAFCCKEDKKGLDADHIVENLCDDGYEEMAAHLDGLKELRAACDAFNATNESALIVYYPDYKRKVRVTAKTSAGAA